MSYKSSANISTLFASLVKSDKSSGYYLSSEGLETIQIVFYLVLGTCVCWLGIVTNVINMVIFIMQGLNTTMNISFFAMAVSDLCSLFTLEWVNVNLNKFMEGAQVPWEPRDIQYLTGGWPHACFARITIWITVYVTAERCLCIAMPLKVKQIITPRQTKIAITTIYTVMLLTLTPEYITVYYGEKLSLRKNRSLIGLIHTQYKAQFGGVAFMLYTLLAFISFFFLVLFTCILVVQLKKRSAWRSKSTFDKEQSQAFSNKDRKTVKMVVLISSILIISFSPGLMLSITGYAQPAFALIGRYANEFQAAWSVAFLAEAINSSLNIILYYKMSTKYRQTFYKLFSCCLKSRENDSTTVV